MALSKPVINNPGEISDEQENYMRLQLLRKLIERILRELFHKHFKKTPGILCHKLKALKKDIDKLLQKGIIGKDQYNLLLPGDGIVDSEKFDATLLIILLQNLCGYDFTKKGKAKENQDDRFIKESIIRCVNLRNKIQHLPPSALKKEMDDIFNLAEQPLLELGATQLEFDGLKLKKIIDKEARSMIKKSEEFDKQFHYGYQPPVKNFSCRDNELQALHQLMKNSVDKDNYTNDKLGVVVSGMGGVGKSQLARQYWKMHQGEFYSDHCIWINGESKENMENDFQIIGEEYGLKKIKNADGTFKELREVVRLVYMHFVRRKDPNSPARKVLFIFDNVEDQNNIKEFLPHPDYAPYILVTSQCREWDEIFDVLPLDVFSEKSAVQFIVENLKPDISRTTTKCINMSNLIGCHPLALQQAILYVNKADIPLNDYMKLFEKKKQKMLSILTNELNQDSVYMVLSLSIERINKLSSDEISLNLLHLISLLNGKGIQKGLLLKFCNGDRILLIETLNVLRKYSIINDGAFDQSFNEQTINIHSLTQYCLRSNLQKENKLTNIMNSFVKILDKDMENYRNNMRIEIANRWYHHFQQIMTNIVEHPSYLATKHNIALCLHSMGNYKEALKNFKEVEKIQKEVIGELHPYYLATKHSIASCLQSMGNYEEALKNFKEVEKIQKEVIGELHPSYLATKHGIASCLHSKGNYEEALKNFKEVEKIQKEVIGELHPYYLATKHSIASCLQSMGNYEKALKNFKEVEKIQKEVIGELHPSYLATKHGIASCLRSMGNYEEALKNFKEVEKIQKEVIGELHPSHLVTKHNIALCLESMGNYAEALKNFKEVEKIQKEVIGELHPSYLATKHGIASCLHSKGNYEEALKNFKEVEKIQKEVIGELHPYYLATKHSIASCLQSMGNYEEALKNFKEVEKIQK